MASKVEQGMTAKLYLILLVALLLGAAGQLVMKMALSRYTSQHGELAGISAVLVALFQVGVLAGLACYFASSVLYLFVMSKVPLSLLYPMVALNYVFVTVLAKVVLHEEVGTMRVVGLSTIMWGVVILALSGQQPTGQPAETPVMVEPATP
jgi:drug/metabolite transporter (DMT)-like permease